MSTWILTEGSRERGFGHVVRCRAIADALHEAGLNPRFVVEGDTSTKPILGDFDAVYLEWTADPRRMARLIPRDATVLVDSLTVSQDACAAIEAMFARTAFLDDFQRHHYTRSLVVDWTIGAERDPVYANRPSDRNVEYLLGARYAALRREFWNVPAKHTVPEIGCVLLMFGGSDIRHLTRHVLALMVRERPRVQKTVIVGNGYPEIESVHEVADANTLILRAPTTSEIVAAMSHADIAVSGGGQTLYELARVGVPTIAIHVIDNQVMDVEGWHAAGVIRVAGKWDDATLESQIINLFADFEPPETRREVSLRGPSLVNGGGARAIRDRLMSRVARDQ